MSYTDGIEPVTTLKSRSSELIRRAKETGQPIVITQNGKPTAVLQDVETYERQQRALLLLKYLARGERDVREGRTASHAEAKKRIGKKTRDLDV